MDRDNPMNTTRDYTIASVQKALRILKLFDSREGERKTELSLMEICDQLQLTASSVMRLLFTLNQEGFIDFNKQTKKYSLNALMFRLGMNMYNSMDLIKVGHDYIKPLSNETGLAVYFASVSNNEILVIDKAFPDRISTWPAMSAVAGSILPMHASGIARLYLSQLSDSEIRSYFETHPMKRFTERTVTDVEELLRRVEVVRREGVAYIECEHEDYIAAICMPILGYDGKVAGGISVSGISNVVLDPEKRGGYLEKLTHTVHEITRRMGG